jgi:hypothetical protein
MSKERELLWAIILKIDGLEGMGLSTLIKESKELLAQPDQDTLIQQGIEKYKRGYTLGYKVARDDYKQKVINAFGGDDELIKTIWGQV